MTCRVINGQADCSCHPDYPNCQPQCFNNLDCLPDEICQNNKCKRNPCSNACGVDATCKTINQRPVCSCDPGWTGNPLNRCSRIGNFVNSVAQIFFNGFSVSSFSKKKKQFDDLTINLLPSSGKI
jgi:hypothetical protein